MLKTQLFMQYEQGGPASRESLMLEQHHYNTANSNMRTESKVIDKEKLISRL